VGLIIDATGERPKRHVIVTVRARAAQYVGDSSPAQRPILDVKFVYRSAGPRTPSECAQWPLTIWPCSDHWAATTNEFQSKCFCFHHSKTNTVRRSRLLYCATPVMHVSRQKPRLEKTSRQQVLPRPRLDVLMHRLGFDRCYGFGLVFYYVTISMFITFIHSSFVYVFKTFKTKLHLCINQRF